MEEMKNPNQAEEHADEDDELAIADRELAFKVLGLFMPYKLKYSDVRRILQLADSFLTLCVALEAVDTKDSEGQKSTV